MKLRDIGIGKRAERDGPNGTEIVEITGVGTRTYYVPVGVMRPPGRPGSWSRKTATTGGRTAGRFPETKRQKHHILC